MRDDRRIAKPSTYRPDGGPGDPHRRMTASAECCGAHPFKPRKVPERIPFRPSPDPADLPCRGAAAGRRMCRTFRVSSAEGGLRSQAGSAPARGWDYVVVGAGAAGCVVAGRLSRTMPNVRIALIEAGGARLGLTTKVPGTAI